MLTVKEVSREEVQQVVQLLSLISSQVEHTSIQVGLPDAVFVALFVRLSSTVYYRDSRVIS